jgi:hypothetical protein
MHKSLEQEINDPIDEIASGPGRASDLVVSQKKKLSRKAAKSGGQQIAQTG